MTKNDGWGSEWPVAPIEGWPKNDPENTPLEEVSGVTPEMLGVKPVSQKEQTTYIYTTDEKPWPITGMVTCDVDKEGNVDLTPLKEKLDNWPKAPELTGMDLGTGERTVLTTFENDGIKHRVISQTKLKSQGSNLVDDKAYLYFQCEGCNEILDPHTKSFAKLQEHRVNAGWKCVWNIDGMGYKVYCAKCGEKV